MFKPLLMSPFLFMGLSAGIVFSSPAHAVNFTFTQIADTNTPIPGGVGNFTGFGIFNNLSLDNEDIVFQGWGSNFQNGIYSTVGGTLQTIADINTPMPDGTGNFSFFNDGVSINSGKIVFLGGNNFQQGIYIWEEGSIKTVADTNTPIPDGTGNFTRFFWPSLNNGDVAFIGIDNNFDVLGIYSTVGGNLQTIADTNTLIPDSLANFSAFNELSLDNGDVAFVGGDDFQSGVYIKEGNNLKTIADFNTPIPDSVGNFSSFFVWPSLKNGDVAFIGWSNLQGGIYSTVRGTLQTIVDTNTLIPDTDSNFSTFQTVSLENGFVVFLGGDESGNQGGIYTTLGGKLMRVIGLGDTLRGRTVVDELPNNLIFLEVFASDTSGNSVGFVTRFTDGSQGVFRADAVFDEPSDPVSVPEPGPLLGLLATGFIGAIAKRRVNMST